MSGVLLRMVATALLGTALLAPSYADAQTAPSAAAAPTAATGGTAALVLPLTFYVNNTLWVWHDWRTVTK